jgi:hypothetical protein
MDILDNSRASAEEVISAGLAQEIDLRPFCTDGFFRKDRRWIYLWRKDELPGTGRPDEPLGTLKYNLQGTITTLPSRFKQSAGAFRGMWSEAGSFDTLEQAFAFVKAWLVDGKQVDDLPERRMRRCGIG